MDYRTIKETEFIIRTFSTKKRPEPHGFTGEFYQMFKDQHQPFTNSPRNFPTHFMKPG